MSIHDCRIPQVSEARAFAFAPPPIPGIGTSSGVTFILQDLAGRGTDYLAANARRFQETVSQWPEFERVTTTFMPEYLASTRWPVGGIDKRNLPVQVAKRLPNFPIPVVRLARLAVDLRRQGQRLGEDLLIDALYRCLRVGEQVGILAVLIDAKHKHAKAFYSRYEFESLPDRPLQLWLPMSAVRRLFED